MSERRYTEDDIRRADERAERLHKALNPMTNPQAALARLRVRLGLWDARAKRIMNGALPRPMDWSEQDRDDLALALALLDKARAVISRHIANVLEEGELAEEASLQKLQTSGGRPGTLSETRAAAALHKVLGG